MLVYSYALDYARCYTRTLAIVRNLGVSVAAAYHPRRAYTGLPFWGAISCDVPQLSTTRILSRLILDLK